MVRIRTLNELSQLADSEFNQPPPRHGLNLLFWFAQKQSQLAPKSGVYGFHRFYNRIDDDDDDRLLPNENLLYYEVGNLNATGAEELPHYIRPSDRKYYNRNNKDRIIVRLNIDGRIDRVYVTEHEDQKEFNSSCTYRVSQGLLDHIRGMERKCFLNQMRQQRNPWVTNQSQHTHDTFHNQGYTNQQHDDSWSWCTIL